MSVLTVLEYPDPILLEKTEPVTEFNAELQTMIDDMIETMYHDHGGGLAANQVGIQKRLFVMDASSDRSQLRVFINPEIIERDGEVNVEEGCLSFPGVSVKVKRARYIKVRAQDREGNPFECEFDDGCYAARCVQHESDHLDGVTFFDYLKPLKRQMMEKKLAKAKKARAM